MVIIVMGVAGSGKSTLGLALAADLGWPFVEGDDYHPPENRAKMARGEPLNDADRAPWLARLAAVVRDLQRRGGNGVLACSALKAAYRETLAAGVREARFVFLCGDPEVIRQRLAGRTGHFLPAGLLDSQLADLEPPEDAVLVSVQQPVAAQVAAVRTALHLPEKTP